MGHLPEQLLRARWTREHHGSWYKVWFGATGPFGAWMSSMLHGCCDCWMLWPLTGLVAGCLMIGVLQEMEVDQVVFERHSRQSWTQVDGRVELIVLYEAYHRPLTP